MAETKTILDCWPAIGEDLQSFLSDTDGWLITEIAKARRAEDWGKVDKILEVMEMVHHMSHPH